jgi:hypothetical protein
MKISEKNAYNSNARKNNSAFSILIACDYQFFKERYCLGNINYKINHKAYIKAVANNDVKLIAKYINL